MATQSTRAKDLEVAGVNPFTKTRADLTAFKQYLSGGTPDAVADVTTPPPADVYSPDDRHNPNRDAVNKILNGDGYISPLNEESIGSDLEKARESRRIQAESIFGPRLRRAEKLGEAQLSTTEGAAGQGGGFGLSTARRSLMNRTQGRIEDRIGEIEKERIAYIDSGDMAAEKTSREQLKELREYSYKMLVDQADYALRLEEVDTAAEQTGIENIRADTLLDYQLGAEDRTIAAEDREVIAAEKAAVQNLLAQYPSVGIEPTDSLATAIEKASDLIDAKSKVELDQLQANVDRTRQLINSGYAADGVTIGTTPGFGNTETEKSVREDVTQTVLEYQGKEITPEVEATIFNTIRGLYSASEATDDGIRSVMAQSLGTGTAVDTETTEAATDPTKVVGTGNFANTTLKDRAERLQGKFPGRGDIVRDELIKNGYPKNLVNDASGLGGFAGAVEDVSDFFTGLFENK